MTRKTVETRRQRLLRGAATMAAARLGQGEDPELVEDHLVLYFRAGGLSLQSAAREAVGVVRSALAERDGYAGGGEP